MTESATPIDRSKAEFVDLAADAEKPAVVRASASLDADVTPLAAYATLVGEGPYGFLLESGEKVASSDPDGAFTADGDVDKHARYSFVGYDPEAIVSVHPDRTDVTRLGPAAEFVGDESDGDLGPDAGDAIDRIRAAFPDVSLRGFPDTDRQILSGGFVGFLAYEAVYDLWLEEVGVKRPETEFPDAEFALTTRTVVFDDKEGTVELVFTPIVGVDDDPATVYDDLVAEAERVGAELRDASPPTPDGIRVTDESADPERRTRRRCGPPNGTSLTAIFIRA